MASQLHHIIPLALQFSRYTMIVATIHALIVSVLALGMLQCCSSFTILTPKVWYDSVSIDEESTRRHIILAAHSLLLPSSIVNAAETPAESIRLLSSKVRITI